jgi:hypothetical protein
MYILCSSSNHVATLSVDSLTTPPEGDVEEVFRHGLGLTPAKETITHNLEKALKLNLAGRQISFHLNGEVCTSQRDIVQITTTTLAPNSIVKLHLPSTLSTGRGTLAMGSGGDDEEDDDTDE